MDEKRYLTVTALTKYMKAKIERDRHLQSLLLKGEISNFKYHSRGHMYFTLKDENARIAAVMFAGYNRGIGFVPEDGMKVLVQGEVSLYEPAGSYQLYVKEMQPDGIGNLHLAYEQLKRKLEGEGLFSPLYKQEIPKYPTTIGVITSPTGAAVRDVLTTIERRYPVAKVVVIPTLVQGGFAAPSIVQSIQKANERGEFDVLIVGRGGGSIEELWAFNEEIVARAIADSKIPIISAVGHETDFTIADFVADLRAPTPTAAAEMAVPSIGDVLERIEQRTLRLQRAMNEKLQEGKNRLKQAEQSYAFRYPKQLYEQKEQQLDRLLEDLTKAINHVYDQKKKMYEQHALRLDKHHPHQQVEHMKSRFANLEKNLQQEVHKILEKKQQQFSSAVSRLEVLNPLHIMNRGYSVAYNEEGSVVKSVKDIRLGESLKVQMQDGHVDCHVQGIEERELTNE
ncbi:exodeoxyribonuclease VII large subunit [Priestia taiwanensis]|uniref:Exodeoxyribonuclease 7 large subunit n=1 Tax=Priestia taiwanensis TaxID=1347902 RepID=A0A917AHK8_9BACI|nr:exodeoxyribonuclease VII large subunit [Priestia taiwanensis]MBM7361402.1 exodeoxyribonuclease VII large subunit [Priestia taiwanensis]GGE53868.1 exodeoxyribonuclease 7 large subunit [Priestia taiwanensis]